MQITQKKVLKINDPNKGSLREQKKKKKTRRNKLQNSTLTWPTPVSHKMQRLKVLYGVRLSGKGILHRNYLCNFIFTYVTSQSRWQHEISMPYINFFSKDQEKQLYYYFSL